MHLRALIQTSCLALVAAAAIAVGAGAATSPRPTNSFTQQLTTHEDGRRSDPNIYGSVSGNSVTRPVVEIVASGGFHWADAGVGVGAALGVVVLTLGGALLVRSSRLTKA